jgi:Domain of unknown function (DUF6898)
VRSHDAREVLLEYVEMNGSVRACAIDVATGTEICIVGPASAGEAELRRNALARLDYVLRQKSEPRTGPLDRRPGLLV